MSGYFNGANASITDSRGRLIAELQAQIDAALAALQAAGVTLGTEARIIPVDNGLKIQVSADGGATWADGPTYTAT